LKWRKRLKKVGKRRRRYELKIKQNAIPSLRNYNDSHDLSTTRGMVWDKIQRGWIL